jgi:catechol 2,3-dioxygenase-like lactoylglutathione lyase family enzyme
MKIDGVIETALHVDDVERSAVFYENLFGVPRLHCDPNFGALALPGPAVLLLFKRDSRTTGIPTPGGVIPPHGGSGQLHVAFKISREDLESCAGELTERGIAIESRVDWPEGGTSLYFRDPDQHLIELITPGCWKTY